MNILMQQVANCMCPHAWDDGEDGIRAGTLRRPASWWCRLLDRLIHLSLVGCQLGKLFQPRVLSLLDEGGYLIRHSLMTHYYATCKSPSYILNIVGRRLVFLGGQTGTGVHDNLDLSSSALRKVEHSIHRAEDPPQPTRVFPFL